MTASLAVSEELVRHPVSIPTLVFQWCAVVGSFSLEADGSLRYAHNFVDGDAAWVTIYESPLSLNASGSEQPGWELSCAPAGFIGNAISSYNVTVNTTTAFMPRASGTALHLPITTSGAIILLDGSKEEHAGNHLGAVQRGSTAAGPLWTTSRWCNWTLNWTRNVVNGYNLSLYHIGPQDGSFGAANPGQTTLPDFLSSQDATLSSHSLERAGWTGRQTSFSTLQTLAFGVGQFGTPNFRRIKRERHFTTSYLAAGNAFSPAMFVDPVTGSTFFTHNDENQHGGVHVWKVSGGGLGNTNHGADFVEGVS